MTIMAEILKRLSLSPLATDVLIDRYLPSTGVSVGKRGKSRRVYDAFVEDESVAFGACDDA